MAIKGLVINETATSCAATGGSAITFVEGSREVKNGTYVIDSSEANFLLRKNASFISREPSLNSDGSYTKGKRQFTLVHPKQIADASLVHNLGRVQFELHPEMTAAEVLDLRLSVAQMIFVAAVDDFYNIGTTS
jgi:hypothetical protein